MRAAALMALALTALPAQADVIDLSSAKIVRARKENEQQKIAADELEKHLGLVCGRTGEGNGPFSFVFARPQGAASVPYSAFAKREGNTIWFWGDDKGAKRYPYYGSAFAVYGFLETVLGVRWVEPGDIGIVFTPKAKVELAEDWTYEYHCRAETALMRRADPEYGRRMRYAERRPFKYGHAFRDWQKRFLKTHPEYLGLSPEGVRGVPEKYIGREKLCLSNPDVIDVIVADWKRKGAGKYMNICPNDGTPGYCFCANCRALDADLPGEPFFHHKTDRYLNFWNRLVGKVREVRPDVLAVSYIYSYYRFRPRRERIEFSDNMIFGIVPSMNDDYQGDFAGFKAAGLKNFFFRPNYLSYRGELPRGLERFIYDTFHFYHREGSIGFDYDGGPKPVMALEYYVTFRETAFPELSFDTIIDEYCSQYGAAADVAKAYYARIRERGEASRAKVAARMKAEMTDVLDDSELSGTVAGYHSAEALAGDLAVLDAFDASRLTGAEAKRFGSLKAAARNYIEIFPRVVKETREAVARSRKWEQEKRSVGVGTAQPTPPSAAAQITIESPAQNAVVRLLTEGQREFIDMPEADRHRFMPDENWRKELKKKTGYVPAKVRFAWSGGGDGARYRIEIRRLPDGKPFYAANTRKTELELDNFEIARTYELTVSCDGKSAKGTFRTEDRAPRFVRLDGVPNMRDRGGRIGLGGRRVKQGLVYRSAGLNNNANKHYSKDEVLKLYRAGKLLESVPEMSREAAKSIKAYLDAGEEKKADLTHLVKDWHPGAERLNDVTRAFAREQFGIRTDLDLRTDRECYGMTGSPLGAGTKWVHIPSSAYTGMFDEKGKAAFKECFKVFLDEHHSPIDFHCIAGADRTGSLAYILNALLGVNDAELQLDWEVTAFNNPNPRFETSARYDKLVAGFNAFPGATSGERVAAYVKSLGFTDADIEKLRSLMLEDNN